MVHAAVMCEGKGGTNVVVERCSEGGTKIRLLLLAGAWRVEARVVKPRPESAVIAKVPAPPPVHTEPLQVLGARPTLPLTILVHRPTRHRLPAGCGARE